MKFGSSRFTTLSAKTHLYFLSKKKQPNGCVYSVVSRQPNFCNAWWENNVECVNQASITGTTNGLRHGTECGVPMREELVTVCVRLRGDAGGGEVVRARILKC